MHSQIMLVIIIVGAIGIYIAVVMMMPKKYGKSSNKHVKSAIGNLKAQQKINADIRDNVDDSLRKDLANNMFVKAYLALPFADNMALIEQAGLLEHFDRVAMAGLGLLILLFALTYSYGPVSIILAPVGTFMALYFFINMRAKKRRKQFLDLFPDALDIIVRSVKAGYPISNSIAMVADSMPPRIGAEYTRVVTEAAYGYTLAEAVGRFAERVDQPDVNFFSVVIGVQQETGGNLSEILGNLSSLIRQRKHLRLKVKALSAEGKMTVVVLVGIAFFMVLAVYFSQPSHFKPLLETSAGHTVMTTIACIFMGTFFVIRKIINFKI